MKATEFFLDDIRDILGPSPRRFGFWTNWSLWKRPPSWMAVDDELMEVYRWQRMLLAEGEVYWGALVQANNLLFKKGRHDHPAMTVYAADNSFDRCPEQLQSIAWRLYSLKNTKPNDPEQCRFAEMITGEMERGMGWTIPRSYAADKEVLSTTFMVFRAHIPKRILVGGLFPLLVHPDTPAVMIVPHRFWPPQLVSFWSSQV